ncbi:Fungal transcriptional regulatory protein, N-terminal [Purpureocillium lavendulum]|uniref:Fungal transcriptional regulatory protein, N-terminal n=1 Tax=Purpureocillium lavendulum TaxID=1247861 RepID=A0AB34FIY2_9HYPO|nr:Fungal transcriptional regulatory protein, N-terminal [Purpureocillium lavendulum]
MSSAATTTTSSSVAPASTTASCANLYDIPTADAACAMPHSDNNVKLMSSCCKGSQVVSYFNKCGLYCLAQGQSVGDLTSCLYKANAPWNSVFCRGNTSATATETGTGTVAATASASVIASASGSLTSSLGASGASPSPSKSDSAAPGLRPQGGGVSLSGVVVGATVLSALFLGAFQV